MATSERPVISRQIWLAERAEKRRQIMADLSEPGATLDSVAKLHGVTRQRVHQVKMMARRGK